MNMFTKRPSINVKKEDCCDDVFNGDGVINGLTFNAGNGDLTATATNGDTFVVNLSSLTDGVSTGLSYDPATGVLTITRSNGLPDLTTTITVPIVVANTLFVMENGDDVTGTRERFDLPYATLNAARDAAQAGDNIYVFAGTYINPDPVGASNILAKDQVTYWCQPGVVIDWTSVLGTASPFWDQNQATTFRFKGHAQLSFHTGLFPGFSEWLSHPDSDYEIECESIFTRQRMFFYNGSRCHIKCSKEFRASWAQLFDLRLANETNLDFLLEAPDLWADISNAGTDTDYSAWGVRYLGPEGKVTVKGRLHYYDSFYSTGVLYHENNKGKIEYDLDLVYEGRDLSNGVYQFDTRHKMLMVSVRDQANWDADLDLRDHVGMFLRWTALFPTPENLSRGRISVRGKIETPDTPVTFVQPSFAGLVAESRLHVYVDLDVLNTIVLPNAANKVFLNINGAPEGLHFSGKVRYNDLGDSSRRFFGVQATGQTKPMIRDFVIESSSSNLNSLAYSPGPVLEIIPCINVYGNVGFDPALFATSIEPFTLSPSVKA